MYIPYDSEIWKDLNDRFTKGNGPTLYEIRKHIADLKQNNLSISSYYIVFKTLWDELSL